MESVLNTPMGEAGGITTLLASVGFQAASMLDLANINPYLTFFTTIGGIIYLWYKIKNERLKNKELKRKLENADRENKKG
jgi:hypothetical protein